MNKKRVGVSLASLALLAGGFYYYTSKGSKEVTTIQIRNYPVTFNPQKVADVGSYEALNSEVASLKTSDINGKIKNYAAKKIEYKDKVLKVELKEGLKYEDGSEVKPSDYLTGMKVLVDPKTKADYASWGVEWVKGAKEYAENKSKTISGFKVTGKNKFEVTTTKHYNFFDNSLISTVWSPVSQKFLDKVGGVENYGKTEKEFLSSGPMKITKAANGQYLMLEKNKKSVLSKDSKVDKLKLVEIKDNTTALRQFKAGKLNSIGKSLETDKTLGYKTTKQPDVKGTQPGMFYLIANRKKVSKDLSRALYLSLDKKYINEVLLDKQNKQTNAIVPDQYKEVYDLTKDKNKNDFDMTKAKKLAKSASKKELTFETFSGRTYPTFTHDQQKVLQKYLLNQWKKLGINVTIKEIPFSQTSKDVMKPVNEDHPFDIAWSGWSPDYPEASTFLGSILGSKTSTNYASWTSKEYDKLVQEAMSSQDKQKAASNYAKANDLAIQEGALQPLFQFGNKTYVKKGGFKTTAHGYLVKVSELEKVK